MSTGKLLLIVRTILLLLFFQSTLALAHPLVRVCSSYLDSKSHILTTRCGFGFTVLLNNSQLSQTIIVTDAHLTHGSNLKVMSLDKKIEIMIDPLQHSADNFSDLELLTPTPNSARNILPMFKFQQAEPYLKKYSSLYFTSSITNDVDKLFKKSQHLTTFNDIQIPIVDPKFEKIHNFSEKGTFFGNHNKIESNDGQFSLPMNYLKLDYVPNTELLPGMSGLPVVAIHKNFIDLIGITKLTFYGEDRSMVTPAFDLLLLIKKFQEKKFEPRILNSPLTNSDNQTFDLDGFRWLMHSGITYREHSTGIRELDQQTLATGGGDGADAGDGDPNLMLNSHVVTTTPSHLAKWNEPSLSWKGITEKIIALAFSPFQNTETPPIILSPTFTSLRVLHNLGYFNSHTVTPITSRLDISKFIENKKRQAKSDSYANRVPIFCKIKYAGDNIELSIDSHFWLKQSQNPEYIKIRLNSLLGYEQVISFPKEFKNLTVNTINANTFLINSEPGPSQSPELRWFINTFGIWGIDPQTSEVDDATVSLSRYPYIRIASENHQLFPRALICEVENLLFF